MNKEKLQKAIWDRVNKKTPNDCWLYKGSLTDEGYGRYAYRIGPRKLQKNKKVWAHRVVYESVNGEIPKGKLVRHSCHNPSCCNPNHLLLGTDADNARDKVLAGRSLFGERNNTAKLNERKIKQILKLRSKGYFLKEIAKKFNVHLATIGLICQGKTWKHLNCA